MGHSKPATTMPLEQAQQTIKTIVSYLKKIDDKEKDICFHGGEPSLLGADYLANLYDIIRTADNKITISIQSNLLNIPDDLIKVFAEYDVRVSTSIDGPISIHDKFRKDKVGNGTFSRVMANVNNCQAKGLEVGLICTLNQSNCRIPEELYYFFKGIGLPYKINWVHKIGGGTDSVVNIDNSQLSTCIIQLLTTFLSDESPSIVDDTSIEFMIGTMSGKMVSCSMKGACQKEFICVEANGDVYPCDAFSYLPNAKKYCFGNIITDGEAVFNATNRQELAKRGPKTITECYKCKYQHLCHGGCLLDSQMENIIGSKNSFCEAYHTIFDFCAEFQKQHKLHSFNN